MSKHRIKVSKSLIFTLFWPERRRRGKFSRQGVGGSFSRPRGVRVPGRVNGIVKNIRNSRDPLPSNFSS
ncbi:MAG: hypothetical protein WKF92_00160 [Pyrinomonadaceae bacterium]